MGRPLNVDNAQVVHKGSRIESGDFTGEQSPGLSIVTNITQRLRLGERVIRVKVGRIWTGNSSMLIMPLVM